MPKLRQIPSTPNEVKVPVITFKRENLHESSKLGGEPWMDRDVLLDQSLLPNPKDGFANAILKVVGKPRLKEGVFKYIPEIVQDVFVRADQFTMTNTFYWLDHGMRNAFKIGYPIYEQKVNINTCTMVNAWFSLSTKEITLCTPTSPDADVPLHEYGHRHLYEARPDFFKSDNKDAFHEYYADEFDKTAMFDREIGESTMYHIYGASAPIEKIDAGLRTLADARKTKYHDFMTSEPHRRSLPFSGVIEILFDDLTDPKGDFQISEYDAWQFRSHLVKNSV
ncbi:hypothetical protein KKA47_02795, partial [bacterium]|nr:hypothetical protein [bacterium]